MKQLLIQWESNRSLTQQLEEVRRECDTGNWRNLLFHVYSGITDQETILSVTRGLKERFPQALIAGSLSAGEIHNGHVIPRGILISAMLFATSDIQIWRVDEIKDREIEVGREIHRILAETPDLKGAELLLPGTQVVTRDILEEIRDCQNGVQIFGGYAGSHELTCPDHVVFTEKAAYDNSVLVITYAGTDLHVDTDKSIGWQRLGVPYTVTSADENLLFELDDRPAAEFYEKFLVIDRYSESAADEVFEFPLMVTMNGQEMLRGVTYIDPDTGALTLAGYIKEGMEVYMSYGNPSEIVAKVNLRLDHLRSFHPQAVLLYSCLTRKIFWEDFVDMEMLPFAQLAPTAGFYTWGEICGDSRTGNPLEYNITMVSVAMREGDAPAAPLPALHVDDSVLRGQAALMQRLTRMVYATTQGLQLAYKDMQELNDKLLDMAEHDSLTGLNNRGKIEQLINAELEHCCQTGRTSSLLMMDVDLFKQVNDTFGHEAGDVVLEEIAALLTAAAQRHTDAQVGRWGGEEFFILLPDATEAEAMAFAERLRQEVASYDFTQVHHVTISIGVLTTKGQEERRQIYSSVDNALYQAKADGRNRVVLFRPQNG